MIIVSDSLLASSVIDGSRSLDDSGRHGIKASNIVVASFVINPSNVVQLANSALIGRSSSFIGSWLITGSDQLSDSSMIGGSGHPLASLAIYSSSAAPLVISPRIAVSVSFISSRFADSSLIVGSRCFSGEPSEASVSPGTAVQASVTASHSFASQLSQGLGPGAAQGSNTAPTGVIVGTVIDVIAALAIGAGLIVFLVFRSRNGQSSEPEEDSDIPEFAECDSSIEHHDFSGSSDESGTGVESS
jgi:hypothetical protein